jgi:hypothetical protein
LRDTLPSVERTLYRTSPIIWLVFVATLKKLPAGDLLTQQAATRNHFASAACCASFCAGSGLPRRATIFSTISFATRP